MLQAIIVLKLLSGHANKQTNQQTNKRDRKQYISDFVGGGKKPIRNAFASLLNSSISAIFS
jgi:hypothetical protein